MKAGDDSKYFAVYTIAGRKHLDDCAQADGAGVLEEESTWRRAAELLSAAWLEKRSLPLLLADAVTTRGVEWLAVIDDIELLPGRRTRVHFSDLQELRKPIPLHDLIKLSDGKPLSDMYIRPYVPCIFPGLQDGARMARVQRDKGVEPLAAGAEGPLAEIAADPKCKGIPETTRRALVNARIGQGGFRERMLALWGGRCAVTGCALPEVLVASHSKAWAASSNEERLDKYNGLLLAAHFDRLFDAGLISFADDGRMLRRDAVDDAVLAILGVPASAKLRFVRPAHMAYLRAHRAHHGFDQ